MSSRRSTLLAATLFMSLCAGTAAAAQLLPSLPIGGVTQPLARAPVVGQLLQQVLPPEQRGQAITPTLDSLGVPPAVAELPASSLLDLRRLRLRELVGSHRAELETDDNGQPVRRGLLMAVDPRAETLAQAQDAGFRIAAIEQSEALGVQLVMLAVPRGLSAREGLKRLRRVAPGIEADFDHVYEPAGAALFPLSAALASSAGAGNGRSIAMIDGGVAAHPSLASASIEQRAFAGNARATGHGTAVASLLVGSQGRFRGAAIGARLFVADVYGGNRAAGSATAIVRALGWAASKRPEVISISLVGPANGLLRRAVQQLHARGIRMVAAVGNDGPAVPPQYPAAYPEVISVTAVDARDRALPEAGRAARLDFAAPGSDMAAALPGQGYASVRGTSFATPLVAARLIEAGSAAALAREAVLGRGKVGRGIVCRPCRVAPEAVGLK